MKILSPSSLRYLLHRHHPTIHRTTAPTTSYFFYPIKNNNDNNDNNSNNKTQKVCFTNSSFLLDKNKNHDVDTTAAATTTATTTTQSSSSSSSSPPTVAKFKNPIVEQLWVARHEAKLMSETKEQQQQQQQDGTPQQPVSKFPSDSETFIDYPFSSNEFLRESYRVSTYFRTQPNQCCCWTFYSFILFAFILFGLL